jgi:uncharacterized protein YjbI with pentapeptide repeats
MREPPSSTHEGYELRLLYADLQRANLIGANLEDANLSGAITAEG